MGQVTEYLKISCVVRPSVKTHEDPEGPHNNIYTKIIPESDLHGFFLYKFILLFHKINRPNGLNLSMWKFSSLIWALIQSIICDWELRQELDLSRSRKIIWIFGLCKMKNLFFFFFYSKNEETLGDKVKFEIWLGLPNKSGL